jgi:hypothetical protein
MEFRKYWNRTWFEIKIITLVRKNNARMGTGLRGLQIFTQCPHWWTIKIHIFILPMITTIINHRAKCVRMY